MHFKNLLSLCMLIFRYETARGIIDSLFGTRAHGDFPVRRREKDDQCSGSGEYPSRLGSGHTDYKHVGVDILIESGKTVQNCVQCLFLVFMVLSPISLESIQYGRYSYALSDDIILCKA